MTAPASRSLAAAAVATLAFAAMAAAQVDATYGVFGAGCPGTGAGLGAMQVVPAVARTSFGSGNAIPLGWSPVRFQQVIAASDLPANATFGALHLRNVNQPSAAINYVVDLQIQVGFTTRGVGGLDPVFATNWDAGAPVTVLPRAQVRIPDAAVPANPLDFAIAIPWATTFAWSVQSGRNLLVEFTVFGNSYGGLIYGYPYDNVTGTSAVWGTPATATTGQVRSFGPALGLVEWTTTAVPRLYSANTPQLGNTFRVRLAQTAPSAAALMGIGLSASAWSGQPLPYDLGLLGAPGCAVLAAAESTRLLLANGAGEGFVVYTLPNDIYLLRTTFYNQAFVVDLAANALGLAVSNGGVGYVGNQ